MSRRRRKRKSSSQPEDSPSATKLPPRSSDRRWVVVVSGLALAGVIAAYRSIVTTESSVPDARPSVVVPDADWTGVDSTVVEAIENARKAVLADPDSAAAWGRLGMLWATHGFPDESVVCYARAEELDRADYRWPYLLAVARSTVDNMQAIADFARAAALDPGYAAFHVTYGNALLREDRMVEARGQFQRALELDDGCAHAQAGLGQVSLREGDDVAALKHLERAYALDPRNREVVLLLATIYNKLGQSERGAMFAMRARSVASATRAADPVLDELNALAVSARAYSDRGKRFAQAARFEEAIQAYRKVLTIRQGNARDYANSGAVLVALGRYDEAVADLTKSLQLDPGEALAHGSLGVLSMRRGDLAQAEAYLNEAIRLEPGSGDAHHNRGILRSKQGRSEEAIRDFRDALELDPVDSTAHFSLGVELAKVGRKNEAIDEWRQARDINPNYMDAVYRLGVALAERGDFSKAIEILNDGLERAPRSAMLAAAVAWILATCPDDDVRDGARAVDLATRACNLSARRDAKSLDVLAAALAEHGEFQKAVGVAREAVEIATKQGNARFAAQIKARMARYKRNQPLHQLSRNR